MLFDHLLNKNNMSARDIEGYQSEEFTHAAVAAYVASGMADTGFGVQPAADQFGLEFIPLAQEKYMFAFKKNGARNKEILKLITLLKSLEFTNYVGYTSGIHST
jgi:molybdate-binding protein